MVALLAVSLAAPAFGEKFYLYTPGQATGEEKTSPGDAVLVQEISIKKGDTLSALSRKFSGKGYYYPQILLFNDIKNPNLIYAGDTLKVPVSSNEVRQHETDAATVTKARRMKKSGKAAGKRAAKARKSDSMPLSGADDAGKSVITAGNQLHSSPPSATETRTDAKLFEKAMKAYRQDDCRAAIELFDRFLADNASSPLAADASLYKAECLLKQSGQ